MTTVSYKELKLARSRTYEAAWRARNKDKVQERNRRYREKNKGRSISDSKRWRAANAGADRRQRYGLLLAEWDALFVSQNKACATCKSADPGGQPWQTDHDHRTGRVRGILCMRCNVALGLLGDDHDSVTRMMLSFASYLSPAHAPD